RRRPRGPSSGRTPCARMWRSSDPRTMNRKESRQMSRFCRSILLAVSAAAVGATQSWGGEVCKPQLSFKDVRFSEIRMHDWRRTWSAVLAADASRCATEGGRFDIAFVRLIEVGPDLPFTEQFTWRPGEFEVSAEFAFDE